MKCKHCDFDGELANKYFKLCKRCNNKRLQSKKVFIKPKKFRFAKPSKTKLNFAPKVIQKKSRIELDEIFYEECFNLSNHKCEECNTNLPKKFRNDDGDVIARWRYSHIIPKSIAPHIRRLVDNINHLCISCHQKWENGDKQSMRIYDKNKSKFPSYF